MERWMCLHMQIPYLYPRVYFLDPTSSNSHTRGQAEKGIWGAQAVMGLSSWTPRDVGLLLLLLLF